MAKEIALHDEIKVDGTDVSNFCRTAGFGSEHTREPVGGFSVSGAEEFLAGRTEQSFEVEFFHGDTIHDLLYPLHRDRTIFPIQWQPDGLIDPTRETLIGNVQLLTFNPNAEFGGVRVMSCTFTAADEDGLTFVAGS